jgi:hypothetical protein
LTACSPISHRARSCRSRDRRWTTDSASVCRPLITAKKRRRPGAEQEKPRPAAGRGIASSIRSSTRPVSIVKGPTAATSPLDVEAIIPKAWNRTRSVGIVLLARRVCASCDASSRKPVALSPCPNCNRSHEATTADADSELLSDTVRFGISRPAARRSRLIVAAFHWTAV